MTSIERICEYRQLKQEAPAHTDVTPPGDWPSQGHITMQHVSLRYNTGASDGEAALKDICLDIKAKEKVQLYIKQKPWANVVHLEVLGEDSVEVKTQVLIIPDWNSWSHWSREEQSHEVISSSGGT